LFSESKFYDILLKIKKVLLASIVSNLCIWCGKWGTDSSFVPNFYYGQYLKFINALTPFLLEDLFEAVELEWKNRHPDLGIDLFVDR